MILVLTFFGGFTLGFLGLAIFAANSYRKGHADGYREGISDAAVTEQNSIFDLLSEALLSLFDSREDES